MKPHIVKIGAKWYCCSENGPHWLGIGKTAREAFDDWWRKQ